QVDEGFVLPHIVKTMGNHRSRSCAAEVVVVGLDGFLGVDLAVTVEIAEQFLLLRIHADDGQASLGAIPKCGHVALVLDCCYVDICVIFSSSGSLRMRLVSQFSRASGARFSETDDSPETVVGRWILPAKLKALLESLTLVSQMVPGKDLMAESKSPLFGIAPATPATIGRTASSSSWDSSSVARDSHALTKSSRATPRIGRHSPRCSTCWRSAWAFPRAQRSSSTAGWPSRRTSRSCDGASCITSWPLDKKIATASLPNSRRSMGSKKRSGNPRPAITVRRSRPC